MLNSRRGFTLMELIVVMAVLSILVAMGVPRFIGYTKDADVTAMKVDAGMLEQVSLQHMLVNGDAWPVGAECSSIDPEVLAIVENVLRRRGSLASVSELAAAGAFCELDEAALSLYVRSTANSLSDYFIVNRVDGVDGYANELEGFVFSKEVFEDRSGVKWSGLYCEEEILLLESEFDMSFLVAAGHRFSLVVDGDGCVWGWGANGSGQLGNGSESTCEAYPGCVLGMDGGSLLSGMVAVAAGSMHSLALKEDGTVYAWGENDYGQVGDGITWDDDDYEWSRPVPVQVVGPGGEGYLTDVAAISAGDGHSLALRSDGSVWAWGKDEGGRLGNGAGTTWEPIPFPVRVLGINGESYLSGVKAVAAGENFSLALLSDSTVCAWGNNGWGQLGDGTRENRLVPVRVPGLSGVIAVDGGCRFSVAACSDGSIWSWGELAGGTQIYTSPVQVAYLPGVVSVSADSGCWAALCEDGTVWVMDLLGYRQVEELSNIVALSVGSEHILAIDKDGILWAWGWNTYGQLGDGTVSQERRLLPGPVIDIPPIGIS